MSTKQDPGVIKRVGTFPYSAPNRAPIRAMIYDADSVTQLVYVNMDNETITLSAEGEIKAMNGFPNFANSITSVTGVTELLVAL